MLKKLFLLLLIVAPVSMVAQDKLAFINAEEVFSKMPELKDVESKLATKSEAIRKNATAIEEEYNNKKNEDKEMVIRIITKFLKEEIIDNNLCIERTSLYEYIKRGHGVQYGYGGIKQGIKLDSYEKIKYELIKYPNEDLVESVIDLYELFYLLLRYDDLKEFDKKEFKKIATIKLKTNEVLKKIGYEV